MTHVEKVSNEALFVSEPDPRMFGNPANAAGAEKNWLKSRFHFSFAEWRGGPSNFGNLRVLNDDLVQPERGFGTHPHANMEIVTYIVDGKLTHKDSMHNQETLGRHSFQYMTAGTGIRHSEHNLDGETELRFLQIWILPRASGLKPNYSQLDLTNAKLRKNEFMLIVDDVKRGGGEVKTIVTESDDEAITRVPLNQDVAMSLCLLEPGKEATYRAIKGAGARRLYIVQVEEETTAAVGSQVFELQQHEALKVVASEHEEELNVLFKAASGAKKAAHLFVIDLSL